MILPPTRFDRLSIPLFVLLAAWTAIAAISGAPSAVAAEHPNVIVIFADDLGYGDVGCFHDDCPFETPNLDRMAAEGARLTSFYVPTPYCAPSRGTILTGRYPFRHSVVRNPAPDAGISNFGLPPSEITIAELLKDQGYATAAFGKWHLGHQPRWLPRTQGFDEYFGILYSNDMFPVQLVENESVVEYPVVQASLTERYTQRTLQFIERHQDQPFFIYLPHAMPHKPLAASDNFYTPETRDDLYADVIAELDAAVGRVLAKLKELSLNERTLVVFTSDNGPWYGGSTGGLRGMKGKTWEGGLRVPMIARMPGVIPAGGRQRFACRDDRSVTNDLWTHWREAFPVNRQSMASISCRCCRTRSSRVLIRQSLGCKADRLRVSAPAIGSCTFAARGHRE